MSLFYRLFAVFFLSGMMTATAWANASASELQALRDGTYRSASQLFMYVILEKAGERRQDALASASRLDARVAALNDAALDTSWKAVREAQKHDLYQDGEANQLAIYAVENSTTAFAAALEQRMPVDTDPTKKTLYDLAGRLQVMMTIYLRNSADPLGGSNYSGVNRGLDPAVLAKEFSTRLDALGKSQPSLAPSLAKVRSKWQFLLPRLTDFNEKSVPYLVDLYGRQIIDQLLVLANN